MKRPPDEQMAAGAAICGKASAVGCGTRNDYSAIRNATQGAKTFAEILAGSTPTDLRVMVDLHRRYLPHECLPAALQRAIGRAWTGGVR